MLAAAAFLMPLAAFAQVNLEVLSRDGYGMVPIKRPRPNTLVVSGSVNGHKVQLVLDTGAGGDGIALDSQFERTLQVKSESLRDPVHSATGKKIALRKAAADSVTLGNAQLKGVPLLFGIFQGLRDLEVRRDVGADGFLANGFLRVCSAIIDLHNLRLYLRPPATGRRVNLGPALQAVGLAEAPFTQVGNACVVDVEVDGVATKMLIDTGASLGGVDPRFAERAKLDQQRSGVQMRDAANVLRDAYLAHPKSFKVGGVNMQLPELLVTDYDLYHSTHNQVAGVIGIDILGQNWSIIDFGQRKLYFRGAK